MTFADSISAQKHAALGLYTYVEFGATVLAFLPIMGASWLRHRGDPTQRMPGRWMRRLGWVSSALTPLWKFRTEGAAPADIDHKAYVVVANHESAADPFLLCWLSWDMRWVAKEELFKLPLLGWTFKFSGDIPLRRGDGDSVKTMLQACRDAIDGGISVMMFPEGTRSKTGQLLPFRDGAFRLAIEAQVPVLPLAILGTRDCLQKHSKWLGNATAAVRVLEPIPTVGMTLDDLPRLRDQARATIQAAVDEMRGGASFEELEDNGPVSGPRESRSLRPLASAQH
jgi:1-acyl-sn-glycerol-3-phosphate acyltransferase